MSDLTEASPLSTCPEWAKEGVRLTIDILSDPKFPCYFASSALDQDCLFGCVLAANPNDIAAECRKIISLFLTSYPESCEIAALLIFINSDCVCLEEAKSVFLNVIMHLKGPGDLSEAQYSVDDTPLFINAHSRFYQIRRSRWSPFDLMLVVQRYSNITSLATSQQKVDKISSHIRSKVLDYDGRPVGSQFGSDFLDPNTSDFDQFWLPDE